MQDNRSNEMPSASRRSRTMARPLQGARAPRAQVEAAGRYGDEILQRAGVDESVSEVSLPL